VTAPDKPSFRRERTVLAVCMVGVAVSIAILLFQDSSRTWLVIVLSSVLAVAALIGVTGVATAAYIRVRYPRFQTDHLERASTTNAEPLAPENQQHIAALLAGAGEQVASEQHVPAQHVRAALFRYDGRVLRIPPGLNWHLTDPAERNIEIPPGQGSAGRAFETGAQNIAVYHNVRDDTSILDTQQRQRVDPELKWIISTPIFGANQRVLGVLNVDGLTDVRAMDDLRPSLDGLLYWAQLAGILFGQGPGGQGRVR
jgi:hypothetical protein